MYPFLALSVFVMYVSLEINIIIIIIILLCRTSVIWQSFVIIDFIPVAVYLLKKVY